jgi:hypothetical protein
MVSLVASTTDALGGLNLQGNSLETTWKTGQKPTETLTEVLTKHCLQNWLENVMYTWVEVRLLKDYQPAEKTC